MVKKIHKQAAYNSGIAQKTPHSFKFFLKKKWHNK